MDNAYFHSRHFLAAAAIAALLVGGAAAAYAFAPSTFSSGWEEACRDRTPEGAALKAERTNNIVDTVRVVTFTLNSTNLMGGIVDACSTVGDVEVVPAPGKSARVVFTIRGEPAAVESTIVEAAFARTAAGGLAVSAWQARAGESTGWFGHRGASADVRVEVPETGAYDVRATTVVGDATVRDLLVGSLDVSCDVGDVVVRGLDVQRDVSLYANVGSVDAVLGSLGTSTIDVDTEVGEIVLRLPSRADIGYDVRASSHVGETNVDLGITEQSDHREQSAGESYRGRTAGFADKPTKVVVTADADVGSVDLVVRA